MQGGELFDRITKQGKLSERLTRFLFRQMVLAVKYLHSQGITHRDLKVSHFMFDDFYYFFFFYGKDTMEYEKSDFLFILAISPEDV